jgi:molybdate transport system substrate-binding protein
VAMVLAAALAPAACGADSARSGGRPRLVVSAAASMTEALTSCTRDYPGATVRLSFAGSDELAAQIRRGVAPDVFAAANTELPDALHDEGRLSTPLKFATNELVLAVPASSSAVRSLADLQKRGVRLAIGSQDVPVGSYARAVLGRLPEEQRAAVLGNVRSNEPDVKGVVGKLTQGAVNAGFVYRSDVEATDGRLTAIALPRRLRLTVTYGAGVVKGAGQPERARRFVTGLASGRCARALRQAGFGPPPR